MQIYGRISIHAPREGGDNKQRAMDAWDKLFQSTPPARGATLLSKTTPCWTTYFNPRPPRGGRPAAGSKAGVFFQISIHAPREGGDAAYDGFTAAIDISIHAPREGGDELVTE